jgi:hypothetical protein
MKAEGKTFYDAWLHVRQRRPVISPNRGFIAQLKQYEELLKASVC